MYKKLIIVALIMFNVQSYANVVWLWKFDTEFGYIVTDGNFLDTTGSTSFNILSFQVVGSHSSANIGANYLVNQPVQGFLWDGIKPTEFFRSSGTYTNGANFFLENTGLYYGLNPPPTLSIFGVAARSAAAPVSGLITLKTELIFKNQFE